MFQISPEFRQHVAGWGMFKSLILKLALAGAAVFGSAHAAQSVLKPYPLSAACQKAGYTALQDASGSVRVLKYLRRIPDNSAQVTQYYAASGKLQALKASASGFVGVLYDLSARVDANGKIVAEKGYRSKLFTEPLSTAVKDLAVVKTGRCQI
jgi:hypothetical protein